MDFPRNLFYYHFLEILLKNYELVFLEFKHFYKTHRTSLFSFYLSTFHALFFVIILCINTLPFHTFPLRVNTLDESVLFLHIASESLCILTLSTFCTFCIISGTKEQTKSFDLTSNTFCCEI